MRASPWGPLPVRDAHVHFFSRRFFDLLANQKGERVDQFDDAAVAAGFELPPPTPEELAQRWVQEIDSHGVDCAALIASLPGDEDSVTGAIRAFPSRFRGYFITNPTVNAALDRAEVAFTNGMHGVCFFPAMHGYSMADDSVEAIVEAAEAQRAVVFVHCGILSVGIRAKLGMASRFDLRYSNPIDVHAIALRHPNVAFVIPHFGAGYLRETLMLASLCPNVYIDTSSSNRWMRFESLDLATVLRRTLDVVGPTRLLFGSDSSFFPRGWVGQVYEDQANALYNLGISESDARKIFADNFSRLFDHA